jgi:uroporphyrinogen decarboxylase
MTGRERILRVLAHKEVDIVPKYDSFWEDTIIRYHSEGLPENPGKDYNKIVLNSGTKTIGNPIGDYFGYDIDVFSMDNSMRVTPRLVEYREEYSIIADRCGYIAKKFNNRASSMDFIEHVNPDESTWQKFKDRFILDVSDSSRIDNEHFFLRTNEVPAWSEVKRIFDEYRKREKFLLFSAYGPYEGTWRHHGYTQTLMDLMCEKSLMHEMFEKITQLTIEIIRYSISIGMKPDGFWMIEDLGSTHSTLFSPEIYREVLWPYHKILGDFLHKENIKFFVHCCGKIDTLLPDFINAGIDVVQPLQANTGMDVRMLKREFGQDLTFWGNISVIELSKTLEDIEREIADKVTTAMKGGGYIYHSDHSIPPTISLKNYMHAMSMLDKYGKY